MLGPPQELAYTLITFLDTYSAGELPQGPEQFAVPHKGQNDKLTLHPVVSWDKNQVPDLPP